MSVRLNVEVNSLTTDAGAHLLSNISFDLSGPGIIWVQGGNGAGKSSLAELLSGLLFYRDEKPIFNGTITYQDRDGNIHTLGADGPSSSYVRELSFLPQERGSSMMAIHHQDNLCLPLEGRFPQIPGDSRISKDKTAANRIANLLERLNSWSHLTSKIDQTSYGETRSMEFACALSSYSSLIILDEPFSSLDDHHSNAVARTISELASEITSIWVIAAPDSPKTYGIEADLHVSLPQSEVNDEGFKRVAGMVKNRFNSRNGSDQSKQVLRVRDLEIKRERPRHSKVHIRELTAEPGSVTFVAGDNGSGKSTILETLAGLLEGSWMAKRSIKGTAHYGDMNLVAECAPLQTVRLTLQNPLDSFVYRTVLEDLLRPLNRHQPFGGSITSTMAQEYRDLKRAWGTLARDPRKFSFSQRRFLQLLLIPQEANIVLLDEPFLGLSDVNRSRLREVMHEIADSGRVVIASTQKDDFDNCYRIEPT